MALIFVGKMNVPTYVALSTDVVTNAIAGASIVGGTVFLSDTAAWKIIKPDLTLADYNIPASISTGDIQIGAVEIKNSTSDTRATVGSNGLYVDARNVVQLPVALGANGGLKIEGIAAGEAIPTVGLSTTVTQIISINTAVATAGFDMSNYIGGMVITPTAWTAANIGFYVCDTLAGTYVIAKDEYGIPIQITAVATGAAGAYAIPAQIFTAKFVKLWSKNTTAATETDINQAAERALKVMLK